MQLIKDISEEKLRGGFYTPAPIVRFILRWAKNGNSSYELLEPSCGDGAFLKEIKDTQFKYKSITALELIKKEAEKASLINLPNTEVINDDFFSFSNTTKNKYDLIIGNPPYIRYQYFDKKQREETIKIFSRAGIKYSKLMNAWTGFVVSSTLMIKEKGKLAFVLPAEILQVGYAKQIRRFLSNNFNKISIVSFRKLIFPSAQQEIVLILCEKNGTSERLIEHIELDDREPLDNIDVINLKYPKKRMNTFSDKWTLYFLNQNEIDFVESIAKKYNIYKIGNYAKVEVGMTTGCNDFFTVSERVVQQYDLFPYSEPMVGRSVQVISNIFTRNDWIMNIEKGAKAFFLKFPEKKNLLNKALDYIKKGEQEKANEFYKCRIRKEWQIVPSAWVSDALFIRRNDIYPRLIMNKANAYTTDTMHRVTLRKDNLLGHNVNINIDSFVASYYNSLSFAFAEICGRSHGGGVLELMPKEVENILLPYDERNASLLSSIDNMLRSGKTIDEIIAYTDNIILRKNVGLTKEEILIANGIWKKMLNRRKGRSTNQLMSMI